MTIWHISTIAWNMAVWKDNIIEEIKIGEQAAERMWFEQSDLQDD